MRRRLFDDEHEAFRDSFRRFVEKEVVPHHEQWERDGIVPHEVFAAAGDGGFLGMAVPKEYGGRGLDDFRYNVVIAEETARVGATGFGLGIGLHNDIVLPYFLSFATDEQKARWLPGIASGELVTAVAMTEPGIGSDLAALRTAARRDGDAYLVEGSKTFITNGINADLVVTAVTTDPGQRHRGMSLLVLERGMPGFERGRNLEKTGQHSQDTAELFFDGVRVPAANLLGEQGRGFAYLVTKLPQERLSIAVAGLAAARAALGWTLDHVRESAAPGEASGSRQDSAFRLAGMATEVDVTQHHLDACVRALAFGELTAEDAAKAKWWATELQGRVVDACVQLHGGLGYVLGSAIARAYLDARVTRIYGGTTEIMKEIVGRSLGLTTS